MTFKDLRKGISLEATEQQSRLFERTHNKPFWIWDIEEHKQIETADIIYVGYPIYINTPNIIYRIYDMYKEIRR